MTFPGVERRRAGEVGSWATAAGWVAAWARAKHRQSRATVRGFAPHSEQVEVGGVCEPRESWSMIYDQAVAGVDANRESDFRRKSPRRQEGQVNSGASLRIVPPSLLTSAEMVAFI